MARFKPSKKTTIITVAVVTVALVIAFAVGIAIKGFNRKVKLSSPANVTDKQKEKYGETAAGKQGQENATNTVQDTIDKEKQAIAQSDKGGFVSAMEGGKGKSEKKEPTPEDILKEDQKQVKSSSTGYDPTKPQAVDKDGNLLSGQTHIPDGEKQGSREKMWAYLYSRRGNGGFIAVAARQGKPGADVTAAQAKQQTDQVLPVSGTVPATASTPQASQLPVQVEYHRPYRAIVDRTFTSSTSGTTFVATMSDPPLKGWKVVGRTVPNFNDLRFNVEVSSVISPDNKPYAMKGFVTSIDQSDGIVSAVKHDDVAGSLLSSVTKGVGTFFDAFRKDTTTVEVAAGGVTVTGQTKSSDRGREAGLAAGSAAFDDISKKMNERTKKNPTLIMEKGSPVLVYFMP